jgi:hypothetical protein
MKMTPLGTIALILVVIGALNWGLVGIVNFNVVDFLLGQGSPLARIIYALVGLSGIYLIIALAQRKN